MGRLLFRALSVNAPPAPDKGQQFSPVIGHLFLQNRLQLRAGYRRFQYLGNRPAVEFLRGNVIWDIFIQQLPDLDTADLLFFKSFVQ